MAKEVKLMKGNEAIAHAAIRYGCDGYFGYPITPQSEIMETLMEESPWETTGMVVLQAESEVAAINMVYGGAGCGKAVMTSSSSPGVSLKQEGISYMAGAELPGLIVNVMRGGPGLGTIQPSQADYFQTTKGGGHGDYRLITLAPASVQEMADFVKLGFDLSFKYCNPAIILADGIIGQMMEKVVLPDFQPRRTEEEIRKQCPWAALGKPSERKRNVITSLELDSAEMEKNNIRFQKKYKQIEENEVRYEEINCEDADYLIVAFGSSARICQKTIEIAAGEGVKIGLLRPITLWPFPSKPIKALSEKVKGILCMELNAGQMIEDVKLAVECKIAVEHYGRLGGIVPDPAEVWDAMKNKLNISAGKESTGLNGNLNTLSSEQINDAVSNLNTMVP
ncbi:MAG: 3-methyl-2-oxobutanoate dehydrogenase subunit VorB [Bacteroidales bacterium]|nr:3-methyl-2-oxobutanoate dehydrogenase subunit VorB [Bacteroidales bacterium]